MTAPKLDVQPGWRGTDPDGGTWVLTTTDGKTWGWRTQEEAEAAGLVPLIPAPDGMGLSIDLGETWGVWGCNTLVEVLTELGVEPGMDLGDVVKMVAEREAAPLIAAVSAPAPLDPGSPEHLLLAQRLLMHSDLHEDADSKLIEALRVVRVMLAERRIALEAERAEAEQDAADRKLATEKARAKNPAEWETLPEFDQNTIIDMVMTGIRAADERAERARQEVSE